MNDNVMVGRSSIEGNGLFATADVPAGTVLVRLGGRLVSTAELSELIRSHHHRSAPYVDTVTIYEDAHLVLPPNTAAHFGNHSCEPNLWYVAQYQIAARHDILNGEELTIDYATISGVPLSSMNCSCGASRCRGEITSEDWRRPELQERYLGHWVPLLERRISDPSPNTN